MTTARDDKVIHAFPQAAEMQENILVPESSRSVYFCDHPKVACDQHTRIVTCVKCGATLDPFDFLFSNARHIQLAWDHHRQAMAKVSTLNESINKLSKEEKRLKGRVRTLQAKAGDSIDIRGTDKL